MHLTLIKLKSSKKGKRTPRTHKDARMLNDPPLGVYTQDKDILITDEYIAQDDGEYAVGPDEIPFLSLRIRQPP